jgi:DNA helicase-2/ATP-dependent DNA helicase PcrA
MRGRRFLDFSTSQSELTRLVRESAAVRQKISESAKCVVVDEVQDINPVQSEIIAAFVGDRGKLTAVGDHRQAIYGFRGGRVDLMAELYAQLKDDSDGEVLNLPSNYRSTKRIIELANDWSDTISPQGSMPNPAMKWASLERQDADPHHVAAFSFADHDEEAKWLAQSIRLLVTTDGRGAVHDLRKADGSHATRGLTYGDVAVLVRSSSSVRTYQHALRAAGIPAVVRAGPDLFSQPELLLFVSCLALAAGLTTYQGRVIKQTIEDVLHCGPTPDAVIPAAAKQLAALGFTLQQGALDRLKTLAAAIRQRCKPDEAPVVDLSSLKTKDAVDWCKRPKNPRRIFPQTILQWFYAEAGIRDWDRDDEQASSVLFHLGQLSSAVKGLETPGWTQPREFRFQIVGLLSWLAGSGRAGTADLLVPPNAVTVTTVHGAKGLEFGAVFLADVKHQRFPSQRAKTEVKLPFDGRIVRRMRVDLIKDNDNDDSEKRLMYVALTRAERYLFVSYSGKTQSRFIKLLYPMIDAVGGKLRPDRKALAKSIQYAPSDPRRDDRLATSFSDLRYFIECPHDFYLRKVLGFTPTIDQAFGFGKGMHNLLREIHTRPKAWAALATDENRLRGEADRLVKSGLFYLRYTTGDPLENMRKAAIENVVSYVKNFSTELASIDFEPERPFETLLREDNVLITGAIDLVRLDNPPRVTIIDFKSGVAENGNDNALSKELMARQIGIYGVAAKSELQYEPNTGLVRYLGERDPSKAELNVSLTDDALEQTRKAVSETVQKIRSRRFHDGPSGIVKNRCDMCDFHNGCGVRDRIGKNGATTPRRSRKHSAP